MKIDLQLLWKYLAQDEMRCLMPSSEKQQNCSGLAVLEGPCVSSCREASQQQTITVLRLHVESTLKTFPILNRRSARVARAHHSS